MDKKEYIMNNIQSKYNYLISKGYEVFGIYLQGSQNYNLDVYDDDYKSDVDTKAIVIPSIKDIILNKKPISTTIELDNKEHIDVKDIRIMFDCFYKQNINFLEILYTKYKIINPKYIRWDADLTEARDLIVRYDYKHALNCMYGMAMQKYVALKHPYPTIKNKIDKFGYDPKQLHHIVRMKDFMERFINGESYESCLIPSNPQELIDIKKGKLSLAEAEELGKQTVSYLFNLKEEQLNKVKSEKLKIVEDKLNKILEETIILRFKEEVNG